MRVELQEVSRDGAVVILRGTLPPLEREAALGYVTRTGALLRVDGAVLGAFDREHRAVFLPPCERARDILLEVERRALPTHGFGPGDGLRWRWMLARAEAAPRGAATLGTSVPSAPEHDGTGGLALWGHSHLDVAWLWTFEEGARKAQRTFANALALMRFDPQFRFSQSQPQLYAYVERDAPELFSDVTAAVASGRWDAEVAALWVEPDCNLPSGESLLRQMLFAHRYCTSALGVKPTIAWLPDSFGFPNTMPTLLAHANIRRFGTTKLLWNDTTPFPHVRWRWSGPDGSTVAAALVAGMDGPLTAAREQKARERSEPVVVGYGDGGGGPVVADALRAAGAGTWENAARYFERFETEPLAEHRGELYLQYHRGTYTTHHDVKAENAWCERTLADVEEALAWAVAVHAPPDTLQRLAAIVRAAWEIVLRNQFHDVLPGTCTSPVFPAVMAEYAQAREGLELVRKSLSAMLPRASRPREPKQCEPVLDGDAWVFSNGIVSARVLPNGTIVELRAGNGRNVMTQGNLLALYADKPKKWDAWNVDPSYRRRRLPFRPGEEAIVDGALQVRFSTAASKAVMAISLYDGDPYLRVSLDVSWHERRALLRVENWLVVRSDSAVYGSPHGAVERSARADTPERRAQFEVPGQRFAYARDGDGHGCAMFALDTYGWNARAISAGGVQLGHSLLRAPLWPDPHADRGDHHLEWAFAPFDGASNAAIERAWDRFAMTNRVRLFEPSGDGIVVAACKPAEDGNGVVVRVRECDGAPRRLELRCGARMTTVERVDALEKPAGGTPEIRAESIVDDIPAFGLQSYRVRFSR